MTTSTLCDPILSNLESTRVISTYLDKNIASHCDKMSRLSHQSVTKYPTCLTVLMRPREATGNVISRSHNYLCIARHILEQLARSLPLTRRRHNENSLRRDRNRGTKAEGICNGSSSLLSASCNGCHLHNLPCPCGCNGCNGSIPQMLDDGPWTLAFGPFCTSSSLSGDR